MAIYIQSGTGAQLTDQQIAQGNFPAGTFFIEAGTGRQLTKAQIAPNTSGVGGSKGGYVNPNNQSVGTGNFGSPTSSAGTTGTSTSSPVPNNPDPNFDNALNDMLSTSGLTADQQKLLREYYKTVASNDQANASKMVAAFKTGVAYSDPIMKAQVALVTDALQTGLSGIAGDLKTRQEQLITQRDKIASDLQASGDYLSLNSKQELQNYQDKLNQDIQTNADNMAAAGFGSSSRNLRAQELLNKNTQGLIESNTRTLNFNLNKNQRDSAYNQTATALQLQQLQDKATQDRIAALRDAEQKLGSSGLTGLGYSGSDVLGNSGTPINSTLERQKYLDAFSFAGNFF